MTNKNIKKMFILVALIILFTGIASATEIDNTTNTITTDTNTIDSGITTEKQINNHISVTTKNAENNQKEICKTSIDESPKKSTSTKTVYVDTSAKLIKELTETNTTSTTKIINLKKGTYNIKTNITLSKQKYTTLIINGNNSNIHGTYNTQFLNISKNYNVTLNKLNIRYFKTSNAVYDAETSQVKVNRTGAIANYGKLTINNCTFQSNKYDFTELNENAYSPITDHKNLNEKYPAGAGAIYNKGVLTIEKTTFNNNIGFDAGAIYNKGTMSIKTSIFKNNYGEAGAICNKGTLTVDKCDFLSNSCYEYGLAAGIRNENKLTVTNSNFKNNKAPTFVGGIYNFESLTVKNTTFDNNKGGSSAISTDKKAYIQGIFKNNKAEYNTIENFGDDTQIIGTFTNNYGKYNAVIITSAKNVKIIGNFTNNINAEGPGGAINNRHGNIEVQGIFKNNKANEGGAIVSYLDIYVHNSKFINNQAKTKGGAIYLDDYELNPSAKIYAIFTNNTANSGGAIYVEKDCKYVRIEGTFTKNHANSGGAITNHANNIKIIANLTQNDATRTGGAIYNGKANLTIDKSNFNNNTILKDSTLSLVEQWNQIGGAIFNNGNLIVTNSNFKNHNISEDGSAINNNATLLVKNSNFTKNDANYGVISSRGPLKIYSSVFSYNYCSAVYSTEDNSIIQGNFTNNQDDIDGVAIYSYGSNLKIQGNFTNNKGSAIIHQGSDINIIGNFNNNVANKNSGAIEIYGDNSTIIGNFTNNKAVEGGAITVYGDNTNIQGVFKNNKANYGGAITLYGKTLISKSQFTNNQATKDGGAIYITAYEYSDSYWQSNNIKIYANFNNNNATRGGAIFISNNCKNLKINSNFTNNHAKTYGGAIYNNASQAVISGTFNYNHANNKYNFIRNKGTNCKITVTPTKYQYSKYGGAVYNLGNSATINIKSTQKTQIEKLNTKITLNNIPNVYKGSTVTISGKIADETGNELINTQLTLNINDNKYTIKTDSTGKFTYKYKTTKTGNNKVTVSYSGNENYIKSSAQKTFTVKEYSTVTMSFKKNEYVVKYIDGDPFTTYYNTIYGQSDPGVSVEIDTRGLEYPPVNKIIQAKFYFKNSEGNIITRTVNAEYLTYAGTSLISGYTPYKVDITYCEMTETERYNFWYGY